MSNSAALDRLLAPAVDWRQAYPVVEIEARIVLDVLAPGVELSITKLVDRIYTGTIDPKVRNRIFKALRAASERGLQRYCTRGEPERVGSVENARRTHWHAGKAEIIPPAKSCCPTCRRPL
jgi:hypothetical protein